MEDNLGANSSQLNFTPEQKTDSTLREVATAQKEKQELRPSSILEQKEKQTEQEAPHRTKRNALGKSQKANAPPFEVVFLAILIAIPIIILLITNRKPKPKKEKKKKEDGKEEEKKQANKFKLGDEWILRCIILVGIVISLAAIYLVLGLIAGIILFGIIISGSFGYFALLLFGFTFFGTAMLIGGFFLIRKAAKKRLGEIDNLHFFAEFFLVLVLISLISLIPFTIGFFLNLLLSIFALIVLIMDGNKRRTQTNQK